MRWEYVTYECVAAGFEDATGNEAFRAEMNRLGSEGWELTSTATYLSPSAGGDAVILFFKRLIPTAE